MLADRGENMTNAGVRSILVAACGLLVFLGGCTQAPPAPPDMREADAKAISDNEVAWVQAFASRDASSVASFWAENASVLFPNMPILNGRAAAQSAVEDMLKDPNFYVTFDPTKVDVSRSGDLGYSQGTYTMASTDPKTKNVMTVKGKYVTVYEKQQDGSWKAVSDIMNADGPAMPTAKK
jgi:uncharacterized protein (TIGR02246 family)